MKLLSLQQLKKGSYDEEIIDKDSAVISVIATIVLAAYFISFCIVVPTSKQLLILSSATFISVALVWVIGSYITMCHAYMGEGWSRKRK